MHDAKGRILVVDDDPGVSLLLKAVFTRLGYEVDCVLDGARAVEKLRAGGYSAVLLDLMLPRMNGFEVLREVRSFDAALLPRLIVVTAASNVTLQSFDDTDIHAMFRKPFDLQQLVSAVQAVCEHSAAVGM